MENRLKLRITRLFHASLNYCASGNPDEIAQKPVFIGNQDFRQTPSPKSRAFCTKKEIAEVVSAGCGCKAKKTWEKMLVIPGKNSGDVHYWNLEEKRQVLEQVSGMNGIRGRVGEAKERICPPGSAVTPANSCFKLQEISKKKKNKKTTKKELQRKGFEEAWSKNNRLSFSSADTGWFSSEEEREKETAALFSSKILSSDSSELLSTERRKYQRRTGGHRRNLGGGQGFLSRGRFRLEIPSAATGKLWESAAVVKRSRDPYNDFRSSMVEMIIEKQIFEAEDLEQLLQCFLSLNASYHHRVIVDVFTEILESLFCNSS